MTDGHLGRRAGAGRTKVTSSQVDQHGEACKSRVHPRILRRKFISLACIVMVLVFCLYSFVRVACIRVMLPNLDRRSPDLIRSRSVGMVAHITSPDESDDHDPERFDSKMNTEIIPNARQQGHGDQINADLGPVLRRLHSSHSVALNISSPLSARLGPATNPADQSLSIAELRQLKRRFQGRKFLFPLLDQGPNNQFLQFRVAVAKARQMNRTLVLPIWLPHNPKFQHFHAGAPPVPSRDKWLDQIWYPFDVAVDARPVSTFVRVIPLQVFRQLSDGVLEACLAPHASGFETYLRLSGVRCHSFSSDSMSAEKKRQQKVRFLGFHHYDYELGTRTKYFGYVQPSHEVRVHAAAVREQLFRGKPFIAAHVRVADAHWERSDCKHTIDGLPVNSVSCGDTERAINHSSIARGLVKVLDRIGTNVLRPPMRYVFLASNLNCSDARVASISDFLRKHQATLTCAQQVLRDRLASDNFVASLVEQEICIQANGFVGSKYSTWTDTVLGSRLYASKLHAYTFEDLWVQGIR